MDKLQRCLERAYRLQNRTQVHFHQCARCAIGLTCCCQDPSDKTLLCLVCGGEAEIRMPEAT
jgi:hypothetical protein